MSIEGDFFKRFKNFDRKGSLGIDKTKLRKGYKIMVFELPDIELNRLLKELSLESKKY